MKYRHYVQILNLVMCLIGCAAHAESNIITISNSAPENTKTADKSEYWLFDPVPNDEMREFSTDRPGKTHSSTTVDAGHFQVESDFINYTYDAR